MCQFPYKIKPKYSQQTKQKIKVPSAFSFDEEGAKEKATKRKRRKKISRSAECLPSLGDADTHAPHMCQFPYKLKPKYSQQTKQKIKVPSAFSFDEEGAKEKATKKKTPKEDFALCGVLTQSRRRRHTRSAYVSIPTAVGRRHRLPQKAGENFNCGCAKTLFWRSKNKVKTQSLLNTVKNSSKGEKINESYI